MAAVLVIVSGGVADYAATPGVAVRVVDLDNVQAGDGPPELPARIGFEELAGMAGIGQFVKFKQENEKGCF